MMIQAASIVAIAYFIITILDLNLLSWQCLNRPIVVAPIIGLVLGDVKTGIIMGASLESIFMGISAIGGAVPADACSASVIAVAYTILTGATAEEGLAIALPIGTVMASFNSIVTSLINSPLAAYWEKLAVKDMKKFKFQTIAWMCISNLIPTVILFLAIAFGVEGLNSALNMLPSWVMNGLTAASSMMVGVGFAILTSMIWDGEVGIFFFVGYALAAYASLGTVPIAILGAAIAVTLFFINKNIINTKKDLQINAAPNQKKDEEDFF
jgi:PTS system mannose-specific IIC component/fructoselysine and glucoselysine-specific PTS system IIC component